MKEDILYKYLTGKLDSEQEQEVINWINSAEENKRQFIMLKNLYVYQSLPETKASEVEVSRFVRRLHTKRMLQQKILIPYAVASLLLIALIVSLIHNRTINTISKDISPITNEDNHSLSSNRLEIYTNNGVKGRLILPDSTLVVLNSGTSITYPTKFAGAEREISMCGEAYFEVHKDSLHPMIINTNKGFKVKVLGTSFNLRAYNDDNDAKTTLYSGKIEIIQQKSDSSPIIHTLSTPDESCTITDGSPFVQVRQEIVNDAKIDSAWKDGNLYFNNSPMPIVIKKLERWHGVTFTITNNDVLKMDVTAKFKNESIVQILELLKMSGILDYSVDGNSVVLK